MAGIFGNQIADGTLPESKFDPATVSKLNGGLEPTTVSVKNVSGGLLTAGTWIATIDVVDGVHQCVEAKTDSFETTAVLGVLKADTADGVTGELYGANSIIPFDTSRWSGIGPGAKVYLNNRIPNFGNIWQFYGAPMATDQIMPVPSRLNVVVGRVLGTPGASGKIMVTVDPGGERGLFSSSPIPGSAVGGSGTNAYYGGGFVTAGDGLPNNANSGELRINNPEGVLLHGSYVVANAGASFSMSVGLALTCGFGFGAANNLRAGESSFCQGQFAAVKNGRASLVQGSFNRNQGVQGIGVMVQGDNNRHMEGLNQDFGNAVFIQGMANRSYGNTALSIQGYGNFQSAVVISTYGGGINCSIQGSFNNSYSMGVFIQGYSNLATSTATRGFAHGSFIKIYFPEQKVWGSNRDTDQGDAQVTTAAPTWVETVSVSPTNVLTIPIDADKAMAVTDLVVLARNSVNGNSVLFELPARKLVARSVLGPDTGTGFIFTATGIQRQDGGDWSADGFTGSGNEYIGLHDAAAPAVVGPDGSGFVFGTDTITRPSGDWATERGFRIGDVIRMVNPEPSDQVGPDAVNGFDLVDNGVTADIVRYDGGDWTQDRGLRAGDVVEILNHTGPVYRDILSVTASALTLDTPFVPIIPTTGNTTIAFRGLTNDTRTLLPISNVTALTLTFAGEDFIPSAPNNSEDTAVSFEGDTIPDGLYGPITGVVGGVDGTLTIASANFVPNAADQDVVFDLPSRIVGGNVGLVKVAETAGPESVSVTLKESESESLVIEVVGTADKYQWLATPELLELKG